MLHAETCSRHAWGLLHSDTLTGAQFLRYDPIMVASCRWDPTGAFTREHEDTGWLSLRSLKGSAMTYNSEPVTQT